MRKLLLLLFVFPYFAQAQYSDFHEAHTGELVFCNEPVMLGKEQEQEIKNTFTTGEPVYAMAYFSKPLNQLTDKPLIGYKVQADGKTFELNFSKPGSEERYNYYRLINQYKDKPQYPIEILPNKDQATNEIEVEGWTNFLKNLGKGRHKLHIQLIHPGGVLAEGELILQWQNFDSDEFSEKANEIIDAISTSHAKQVSLPEEFSRNSRKFIDPDMSEERIKFMLLLSDEFNNTREFKRVVIGRGSDWKILRSDETGEPRYKVNDRPIRVIYKGKGGWCYYVKNVYFSRKYKGNGEYGGPKFAKATDHKRINCRKLK